MAWPDHFAKGLLTSFWRVSQLVALLEARLFISFWFVSHDCFAMACPGHFAKGLLSCPFLCLPDPCFFGWLGQIISSKVCFHFFSCVSQMVALLDGLAWLGRSFCHRFAFMCFHWSPRLILFWLAWPHQLANGLLSWSAWLDCFATCLLSVSCECFAGWLGQIILPKLFFHFFSPKRFIVSGFLWPDGCAGCLGRMICHRFVFISFHVCRRWLLWVVWPDHFAKGFALIAVLDGLAKSFFTCLPGGRSFILPKLFSLLFDLSSRWLLCWIAWPAHFAKGLFSFVFVCLPGDCSAGWLGQIMLPQVLSHFYFLSPTWLLCWMAWHGLARSFCQGFVWCVCRLWRERLLCWMAWPGHFDKGVLSFFQWSRRWLRCWVAWLGQQRLAVMRFKVPRRWLLCWLECLAWLGQIIFAKGFFQGHCFVGSTGEMILPTVCFHDQRFAGWPGQVILPKVCFLLLSFLSQMSALLGGLARSLCHRCFSYFCNLSHVIALAGVARPGLLSFLFPQTVTGWTLWHMFACMCFHVCPRWFLCWMVWPQLFVKG